MRQIGVHKNEAQAHRFAAWLVTQGITAHAEPDGDGHAIWVREENQVERAKEEYQQFRQNPDDTQYTGAEQQAHTILREQAKKRDDARKNIVEMRGRWVVGGAARRKQPLVLTLIFLSIGVGVLTGITIGPRTTSDNTQRMLMFVDRFHLAENGKLASYTAGEILIDIRHGQVWRLITPIFLHGGMIHLAFNMIMLYQLGGRVEDRIGSWRFALLVLLVAVISNSAQALAPIAWGGNFYFGGMSGVVYGVLGYMWMKTVYDPESGIFVPQSTVVILGLWLFAGIFGVLEEIFRIHVANWAHGVGLAVGMALGYASAHLRPGPSGSVRPKR